MLEFGKSTDFFCRAGTGDKKMPSGDQAMLQKRKSAFCGACDMVDNEKGAVCCDVVHLPFCDGICGVPSIPGGHTELCDGDL